MRHPALLLGFALAAAPALSFAQGSQAGPTQSRSGLGVGSHPSQPTGSLPAGSENATTGPQSRPAYPSGSGSANPGAAFVGTQPKPAAGVAANPPGNLSTTTVGPGGAVRHHLGGPADEERAGTAPRR